MLANLLKKTIAVISFITKLFRVLATKKRQRKTFDRVGETQRKNLKLNIIETIV